MFDQITKFANEATTTVTDAINDNNVSERFVSTSDQVLDAVLDVNRRVVDVAVTTADRIVEQINVDLPLGDRFPTPTVAGERYLDFVERAVSLNREMNQRVAEMIKADNAKAVSDRVVATAQTVAKKVPAKKTVARRAPAKRVPAKKTVAKKPVVKKTVAKKTVARKTVAKKTVTRKPVAKKTVAKRPAAATAAK